ncbi:MAG: hypothetical protein OXH00_17080 [Candidatus Poribacteria bacterium]|nr:hypothetical protein [Candidatus Poribacteria bacterium]
MKNLTLIVLASASIIAILSFILTSCGTPIEAQDVIEPSTVTANDLAAILEGMPLSDVKEAILKVDPEVRSLIGVHALNSLPSETAFDTGKLLKGKVREGASSISLDEFVTVYLNEISQVDVDVRALIGVRALNSLNDVSDEFAFDKGKLLEGEVRDGAASALLDELVNACLVEVPHLISPDITDAEMEEFVNSSCFTDMRRKFRDLNQLYSIMLEEVLSKEYTLPPL